MAHANNSCETRASTSTTTTIVDVLEEPNESKDSKSRNDLVAHVEDSISSSVSEFDD
jgi:hypothetical protein